MNIAVNTKFYWFAISVWMWVFAGCAGRTTPSKSLPKQWQEIRYGFSEHTFKFQGHQIIYIDEGPRNDLTPIVLIHGLGMNMTNWQHTIPFLSQHRRVLAIDLLGCGKSDKPRNYSYAPSSQIALLMAFFAQLNLDRVTLIGNSMGGHISLWFASKYPEKVDRLVLIDSTGFLRVPWIVRKFASEQRIRKLRRSSAKFYGFLMFATPPKDFAERMEEAYSLREHDPSWANFAYAFQQSLLGIHSERWNEKLPLISTPTLLIWGMQDELVSRSDAYQFHESIPGSMLALIPECGHIPMWECPQKFNPILANFLSIPHTSI